MNDNKIKFTVAMSVYKNDKAEALEKALNSISIEQTVKPDEILLIVDGPIGDKINKVIENFKNVFNNFKVIRLDNNQGLGNALRLAIENSNNELIARMDSDDIAINDRFEQQIKAFYEDSKLDIIGGDISEFIGDERNIVAYRKVPTTDKEIKKYMKTRCPFNHMTVMYKKQAVIDAGNYEDLFYNEDYYLWIRMFEKNLNMKNTGTILVNVRSGMNMYNRRGGKKYFKSEIFLQKYMLKQHIINTGTFILNVIKRWIVQIILPNNIRGYIFRKFARSKNGE